MSSLSIKIFILFGLLSIIHGATVKVANTMGPGVTVWLKCASKEDTIGPKTLSDGQDMSWSFNGKTLR